MTCLSVGMPVAVFKFRSKLEAELLHIETVRCAQRLSKVFDADENFVATNVLREYVIVLRIEQNDLAFKFFEVMFLLCF